MSTLLEDLMLDDDSTEEEVSFSPAKEAKGPAREVGKATSDQPAPVNDDSPAVARLRKNEFVLSSGSSEDGPRNGTQNRRSAGRKALKSLQLSSDSDDAAAAQSHPTVVGYFASPTEMENTHRLEDEDLVDAIEKANERYSRSRARVTRDEHISKIEKQAASTHPNRVLLRDETDQQETTSAEVRLPSSRLAQELVEDLDPLPTPMPPGAKSSRSSSDSASLVSEKLPCDTAAIQTSVMQTSVVVQTSSIANVPVGQTANPHSVAPQSTPRGSAPLIRVVQQPPPAPIKRQPLTAVLHSGKTIGGNDRTKPDAAAQATATEMADAAANKSHKTSSKSYIALQEMYRRAHKHRNLMEERREMERNRQKERVEQACTFAPVITALASKQTRSRSLTDISASRWL
jgi:hypothetical protein